ncbi:hypothetical protein M0R04_10285 [Candidatus Dojkabacteria bacterium]|jgi:hypothetical protein|nr:hypothetical protein [Candidatus Dojkabacteria bacterium]
MTNNNTLTYRVTQLEKGYEKVDEKLDLLMTNHLPHLEAAVSNIRTEVRVLAIINIGAVILFKLLQ